MKRILLVLLCALFLLTACQRYRTYEEMMQDDLSPLVTITPRPTPTKLASVERVYSKKDSRSVGYPQLSGLEDEDLEEEINELIETKSKQIVSAWKISGAASIDVDYDYNVVDEAISIAYTGTYQKNSSSPSIDVFYTTNVNTRNGELIRLSDFADTQKLIDRLFDAQLTDIILNTPEVAEQAISHVKSLGRSKLRTLIEGADFRANSNVMPEMFSALKKNDVIISINVPHNLGDRIIYLIPAEDIIK